MISKSNLAEKVRRLINFGIDGPDSIRELGTNAKMNEFEAAMGLALFDQIGEIIASRRTILERYRNELKEYVTFQQMHPDVTYNYAYAPVLFDSEAQMLDVKQKLNEREIYPRRYFYPSLDTLEYVVPQQVAPISRDVAGRILCLPIYPGLTPDDQGDIIAVITSTLEKK